VEIENQKRGDQNLDDDGRVPRLDKVGSELTEGKLSGNSTLTRGSANQLKSSGKGGFNHLARVNAPFCFAQVE